MYRDIIVKTCIHIHKREKNRESEKDRERKYVYKHERCVECEKERRTS